MTNVFASYWDDVKSFAEKNKLSLKTSKDIDRAMEEYSKAWSKAEELKQELVS